MAEGVALDLDGQGPGEKLVFDALIQGLPNDWFVIWGRHLPPANPNLMGRETDFIIVANHVVFVLEEKHWGGYWAGDDVNWVQVSTGSKRPSPIIQVSQVVKTFSGYLKRTFPEYADALDIYNRNKPSILTAALPHVVMSAFDCNYQQVKDSKIARQLSHLSEICARLIERDDENAGFKALDDSELRQRIIDNLKGFDLREERSRIGAYKVLDLVSSRVGRRLYLAEHESSKTQRFLTVISLDENVGGGINQEQLVKREAAALSKLSKLGVCPRTEDYFYEDEKRTVVYPFDSIVDHNNLAELMKLEVPTTRSWLYGFISALESLDKVHSAGILHRSLSPTGIWLSQTNDSVMFTGFELAHVDGLESQTMIRRAFDEQSERQMAPELKEDLSVASPSSDLYVLVAIFLGYLRGASLSDNVADLVRQANEVTRDFSSKFQSLVQRALSNDATERPSLKELLDVSREVSVHSISSNCEMSDEFTDLSRIGGGTSATVYSAVRSGQDGNQVVLKVFTDEHPRESIENEIQVLNQLIGRKFIVQKRGQGGRGLGEDQSICAYLEFEHLDGQTLKDYAIAARARVGEDRTNRLRGLLADGLRGLQSMHNRGLIHRDIKPANLFVHEKNDQSENLVIIDFGQACSKGEVGVAGSRLYLDYLQENPGTEWTPTNDLYSLAASFYWALMDFHPYEEQDFGKYNKSLLFQPTSRDEQILSFEVLLLRALSPDPALRYESAGEFLEALQEPIINKPGKTGLALTAVRNETVDELRRYYRNSRDGNTRNRGLGGEFGVSTYITTNLDEKLLPRLLSGSIKLVLFAGNPGDGKTTFLETFAIDIDKKNRDEGGQAFQQKQIEYDNQGGWKRTLGNHQFVAVNDASASVEGLSADEYLEKRLLEMGDIADSDSSVTYLIAANDGRLITFLNDNAAYFPDLKLLVESALLRGGSVESLDKKIVVIDFKNRSMVDIRHPSKSIFLRALESVTSHELWSSCDGCVAQEACPILFNAKSLSVIGPNMPANRLHGQFLMMHLRRKRRLTMRDARSVISYIITGDYSCEDITSEFEKGKNPRVHDRLYFWLASAMTDLADVGLEQLNEIDPSEFVSPLIDRQLNQSVESSWPGSLLPKEIDELSGRQPLSTRLNRTAVSDIVNRRRFFYEGNHAHLMELAERPVEHSYRAFSPYKYMNEFVETILTEDSTEIVEKFVTGLSRILGVFGFSDKGLAIRPTESRNQTSTVVRVFSEGNFELSVTPVIGLLEKVPDKLIFKHRDGNPTLNVGLDAFELIMRASDGYLPTHTEASPLIEELGVFARQLLQRQSESVLIIDTAGIPVEVHAITGNIMVKTK